MKKQIFTFVAGLLTAGLLGFTAIEYQVRKNTAEVDQMQGMYIFHDARPVAEYDVLGTIKAGMTWGGKPSEVRDNLLKKAKKEYPNADGILLHMSEGDAASKADVLKFK